MTDRSLGVCLVGRSQRRSAFGRSIEAGKILGMDDESNTIGWRTLLKVIVVLALLFVILKVIIPPI